MIAMDKRPLERLTFTHRGKVFTCLVVNQPLVAASLELPAEPAKGVWSVTVAGVRRDVFERNRKSDTQENVMARVIAWYERGGDVPAEPKPGTDALR
jgi:hypothetical protein